MLSACTSNPSKELTKNLVKPTAPFEVVNKTSNFADYTIDSSVLASSNQVGYELLKRIYSDKSTENLLFSPISLSYALAMVENGASGSTQEGILTTMSITDENMNTTYNQLSNYYANSYGDHKEKSAQDEMTSTLNIANSLWLKENLKAEQSYVDTLKQFYDAQVFSVDFTSAATRGQMNTWVEDQTNHLLKDTIKELNAATVATLMNTVYFKGSWSNKFHDFQTKQKPFNITSSQTVDVAMMQTTQSSAYYEDDLCQVAALDYFDATMYVILPKDNLSDFLQTTSYEFLQSMIKKSKNNTTRLSIEFPKFKYQSNNTLKDYLITLGMEDAFDRKLADFSKMIQIEDENVFISDVFQNAAIAVDENGTEAAAVTVVEMETTSAEMPSTDPIPFNCNKPFLFVIKDNQSNTDLFVGILENPVQ